MSNKPIPALTEEDKRNFFAKISTVPTDDGCLEWQAQKDRDGYGRFRICGQMFGSHRITYRLFTGIDPGSLVTRHSCHNPCCCNPAHLSTGTQKNNMEDRCRAGRTAKGVKNGRVKLTELQVMDIRNDIRSLRKIALEYGMDPTTIGDIKNRKLWAHVA